MSNYVDERTEHIQRLTRQHQAYFDICKQELHADISVLKDLIWDIKYIIGDLIYDKDFFDP
jgi:lipopolysaccharide biosynthesis protein